MFLMVNRDVICSHADINLSERDLSLYHQTVLTVGGKQDVELTLLIL